MRKTPFFLALALIVVAYGSLYMPSGAPIVANSANLATKVAGFSEPAHHEAVKMGPQYVKFAEALEAYNKKYGSTTTIVKKGTQRAVQASVITVPTPEPQERILPVFDQPDILPKHQRIAHEALTSLPERCWSTLENFYVRYDNPKSRGLAGATVMILDGGVPDDEFYALFMHEIGHVFDLNQNPECLGGTIASGISEFKDGDTPMYNNDPSLEFYRISWQNEETMKPGVSAADFVSGYASTNVFEDFAESHTLFVTNNDAFRALALTNTALALKYNFFVNHLYPNGIAVTKSKHINGKERPWDTTKLAFERL